MAEVSWPAELLIGKINWVAPHAVVRQTSPWTGATREVELGPAGRWAATVPVHVRDRIAGARAFRAFDARMRQAGAWTRLAARSFPQAADDPVLAITSGGGTGARSAVVASSLTNVALARAGDLLTIKLAADAGWQMVTLLSDIDVGAGGTATISWAEPLRTTAAGAVEAYMPFVPVRYAENPGFAQLPGAFFEIDAISFEEAF